VDAGDAVLNTPPGRVETKLLRARSFSTDGPQPEPELTVGHNGTMNNIPPFYPFLRGDQHHLPSDTFLGPHEFPPQTGPRSVHPFFRAQPHDRQIHWLTDIQADRIISGTSPDLMPDAFDAALSVRMSVAPNLAKILNVAPRRFDNDFERRNRQGGGRAQSNFFRKNYANVHVNLLKNKRGLEVTKQRSTRRKVTIMTGGSQVVPNWTKAYSQGLETELHRVRLGLA